MCFLSIIFGTGLLFTFLHTCVPAIALSPPPPTHRGHLCALFCHTHSSVIRVRDTLKDDHIFKPFRPIKIAHKNASLNVLKYTVELSSIYRAFYVAFFLNNFFSVFFIVFICRKCILPRQIYSFWCDFFSFLFFPAMSSADCTVFFPPGVTYYGRNIYFFSRYTPWENRTRHSRRRRGSRREKSFSPPPIMSHNGTGGGAVDGMNFNVTSKLISHPYSPLTSARVRKSRAHTRVLFFCSDLPDEWMIVSDLFIFFFLLVFSLLHWFSAVFLLQTFSLHRTMITDSSIRRVIPSRSCKSGTGWRRRARRACWSGLISWRCFCGRKFAESWKSRKARRRYLWPRRTGTIRSRRGLWWKSPIPDCWNCRRTWRIWIICGCTWTGPWSQVCWHYSFRLLLLLFARRFHISIIPPSPPPPVKNA